MSTRLLQVIDDCQFISSKSLLASLLILFMKTLLMKKVSAQWVLQMFS